MKNMIHVNLSYLRNLNGFSLEYVSERIGVSRQAVAKWETGETTPDLVNTSALAKLYDVSIDDLINYDAKKEGTEIGPKGKHIFGTVTIGERGQIVIPKKARDMFNYKPGDSLIILGDEETGLALMKNEGLFDFVKAIMEEDAKNDCNKYL